VAQPKLRLATIVSMPFAENTYIAQLEGRDDCLVVDPGLEPMEILQLLDAEGLTPAAILNTHGHGDHIAGNAAMKERWPDCPLVIGRHEAPKLTDAMLNLSGVFGVGVTSPPADILLDEGDVYRAAGLELEVFEIPGHSSGHIVFVWRGHQPYYVFGGDVLFAGSVGRCDFPGCDFGELARGIHTKLFTLPDDTVVLPGHGEPTTVGQEKRTNPFVGVNAQFET
jgi:glyoxylase-like metal-dependent hydrolase (beta-lactamase superfamily II)